MSEANLYYQTLHSEQVSGSRLLNGFWAISLCSFLIYFCWNNSLQTINFFNNIQINLFFISLIVILKSIILVESVGYLYHRFFQHLGFLTRIAHTFRRNQKYHWIHHMILYPIGPGYSHLSKYKSSEQYSLSWFIPGFLCGGLYLITYGINYFSLLFLAGIAFYAILIVDQTHSHFHLQKHWWDDKSYLQKFSDYFEWISDIHILHHWNQRYNFTIVNPLMDFLCGTYLSPSKFKDELRQAKQKHKLNVSDFINWKYLLTEATPAEYALFISCVKEKPIYVSKKLDLLSNLLLTLAKYHPNSVMISDLNSKLSDLLFAIDIDQTNDILKKYYQNHL